MKIRNAHQTDAADLLAIYTPYVTETTVTFETEIPSTAAFETRIKQTQERFPYLVAEVDGKPVGYAYAHTYYPRAAYDWTVEVSIYVDTKERHAGIGTALYDALEQKLLKQGFVSLLACISLPNDASVAFHQKRGYEKVAHFDRVGYKFERWIDVIWMQKRLSDPIIPTPIVKPV